MRQSEFIFHGELADVDPDIQRLITFEEERQARRIILIPSESAAPAAVRAALGSVFQNVYAEGYPPVRMTRDDEEMLLDYGHQLAYYRRYSDRRFYKGTDYVDFAETLAQRRAAVCFANERVRADQIFANVQPLSGAAANNSIYDAFVEPGQTVMGMNLMVGGHLTHGSEFNRSGKRYHIVSYTVDPKTERLDYDAMMQLALEYRPKMIIAGYTSYPWAPDWQKFREIANAVGAVLMADIAHTAGMAIAGAYPNPVGIADVTVFTTHKTICGPRAAVILTTDEEKAAKIDSAVFPGEQGGPHVNKHAAMAVAFKLAQTPQFKALQHQIVANARALASGLQKRGLRLAYGGTDTHLMCVDLKSAQFSGDIPLRGEMAARLLEICGIIVNKNTIPGDTITALSTGIRLGTPWATQRGMREPEMDCIADFIQRVVNDIHPFRYVGLAGELPRGKMRLSTLQQVRREVDDLAAEFEPPTPACSTYPHYHIPLWHAQPVELDPSPADSDEMIGAALREGALLVDQTSSSVLALSSVRAHPFLQEVGTANLAQMQPGDVAHTFLLNADGSVMDDVTVIRQAQDGRGRDRYLMLSNAPNVAAVKDWFRALSDGYVLFDNEDIMRKVQGPIVVEDLTNEAPAETSLRVVGLYGPGAYSALRHSFAAPDSESSPTAQITLPEGKATLVRLPYANGGYQILASPAILQSMWKTLADAGATPSGEAGWEAMRKVESLPTYAEGGDRPTGLTVHAGGHESEFDLTKPYFVGQKALSSLAPTESLPEFVWQPDENAPLRRTPLYEEHRRLTRKLIPFAGWEMPVWYTSVSEEHAAVRQAAGLFDVAHMGVLEASGPHAASFLDTVTSNYAGWLDVGQSQYAYLLDPDGNPFDDIIVYRVGQERFMIVVNAANAEKDWAWLTAANEGRALLDRARPYVKPEAQAVLRNLKDQACGQDCRVDLALQGPASLAILQTLAKDALQASDLAHIRRTELLVTELAGMPIVISRTGYTGEVVGFELFVHPDNAVRLWNLLLEKGAPFGAKPAALAARDSTRIEAGLPLYGQELAGDYGITPIEAGFAAYVKFHKPFFAGREAMIQRCDSATMSIVRFQVNSQTARALRGHEPVVNKRGQYIGRVTSCTLVGKNQIGMALVDKRYTDEGTEIAVFPTAAAKGDTAIAIGAMVKGDQILLPEWCTVLPRFRTPETIAKPPGVE